MKTIAPELSLMPVKKTASEILKNMAIHYSQPGGFVGRSICYLIMTGGICYGSIVGGSATRFLPGRKIIGSLNNGVNNIFFHIEKQGGEYPLRNFTKSVLKLYRETIERDWFTKYNDRVLWHETLVEPPRTGDCYRRDRWRLVGQTKGYTCKRIGGKGFEPYGGQRVWDRINLRPKLVFVHRIAMKKPKQVIYRPASELAHLQLCEMIKKKKKTFAVGEKIYHLKHFGAYYYACPDLQIITKFDDKEDTYWFGPVNTDYRTCAHSFDLFRNRDTAIAACEWRNKQYRAILRKICAI